MYLARQSPDGKVSYKRVVCERCGNPKIIVRTFPDGSLRKIYCLKCGFKKSSGRKGRVSKMEPYKEEILNMFKDNASYTDVISHLKEKYGMTVQPPNLYRLLQMNGIKYTHRMKKRSAKPGSARKYHHHDEKTGKLVEKFRLKDGRVYATYKCMVCKRDFDKKLKDKKIESND